MEWGIGFIVVILLFITYVVVQETRAQMFWRSLVEKGDLTAIRELVETEAAHWRSERVPRDVPALLWHGIQTVELLDLKQGDIDEKQFMLPDEFRKKPPSK